MTANRRDNPVWFPCGDQALMLDFTGFTPVLSPEDEANQPILHASRIRRLADLIRHHAISGVTEIIPSVTRLTIRFDGAITSAGAVKQQISLLIDQSDNDKAAAMPSDARALCLPICYEADCAPDLAEVAERTGLTTDEVIARHLANQLEVSMMGFMPGLGYLTGVDDRLTLPRRTTPRTAVPARSVGIAIGQCVIYPLTSPGGWHLIGRIAYPLFDTARQDPILLRTGDKIRFARISYETLKRQEDAYQAGTFTSDDLIDKGANP